MHPSAQPATPGSGMGTSPHQPLAAAAAAAASARQGTRSDAAEHHSITVAPAAAAAAAAAMTAHVQDSESLPANVVHQDAACGAREGGRGRGGACPQAEAQQAARAYMTKRQPRFCLSSSRHPRQHAGVGLGIAASGRDALLPAHGSRRQPTRRPPPTVVQVGVLCDFQQRADAGEALRKRRAAQQGFRIGEAHDCCMKPCSAW